MDTFNKHRRYAPVNSTTSVVCKDDLHLLQKDYPGELLFITKEFGEYLYKLLSDKNLIISNGFYTTPINFKTIEKFETHDEILVLKWLNKLPLQDDTEIFVLSEFGGVDDKDISLSWRVFKEKSMLFFYRDNLIILDESATWVMLYHHDDYVQLGRN